MNRIALLLLLSCAPAFAKDLPADPTHHVRPDSKVFLAPMNGFETDLAAAFIKKHVPVSMVDDRSKADYIIEGSNEDVKPGVLKSIFVTPQSAEHASITVKNTATGDLVYAYAVDKAAALHGPQSAAEACAKHLKENIEKR